MQNQTDISNSHPQKGIDLDELREKYYGLSSNISKRANRVLDDWRMTFFDDNQFLRAFANANKDIISNLPGCNFFTRVEILRFQKNIINGRILYSEEKPIIKEDPKTNISIADNEIERAESIKQEIIEDSLNEENTIHLEKEETESESPDMSLPSSTKDTVRLKELSDSLGHFPFFATIDFLMGHWQSSFLAITDKCTRIYKGNEVSNLADTASELGISYNVLRNRRNDAITMLEEMFRSFAKHYSEKTCPYRFQMRHVENEINESEGTHFSLPFIYWALGSMFEDVTLIGDPKKVLISNNANHKDLFLAPTSLCEVFDFQGFIDIINSTLSTPRTNEESISLRNLMSECFKVKYYEEYQQEVELTCRTFLYITFPVEVDYGNIIFPANKKKTNIQIVEDILLSAGRPMTLTEILDEFIYEYPERDVNENRIRGAIRLSDRVIPTMPPGTFAVDDGKHEEYKSASVCTYLRTFLQSLPEKIATSTSATEYVKQYIPGITEEKVVNRLYSEEGKEYALYFHDGVRYIGYTSGDYPDDYFCFPGDYRVALFYSTFFPRFIQFVDDNHHFPFSSGVDIEEKKLRNSWIRTELDYNRGLLETRTSRYFKNILDKYGIYKIDKPEFLWKIQYSHIARDIELSLSKDDEFLLRFKPEKDNISWLKHVLSEYKYRIERIPDWKKERTEKLINQLQSNETIYSELLNNLNLNV